ncbi:Threonylcarbamoyladenosine tRNA methylthiotransferase [Labeo rohita]|uniref:Threonylcarbamoyladenosine tRNA methylthiotransferase n=1 Tax=Labeo rohita TaxID=84645 RepID=A0ABQ8LZN3_LABRO|nr:Threonylcarbamoyladenosine tRNA methylthiotransferase [Labeo rohita]
MRLKIDAVKSFWCCPAQLSVVSCAVCQSPSPSAHGTRDWPIGIVGDPLSSVSNELRAHEMAKILNHPRVYAFLHVPVQSASDSVLMDMKREYCCADFRRVVDFLKENAFVGEQINASKTRVRMEDTTEVGQTLMRALENRARNASFSELRSRYPSVLISCN